MIQSLSRALLWPVLETRGGLDAMVTPGLFSQGQKQLFSLARAILRKLARAAACGEEHGVGGILLLDEATSNLDATTDMQIQRVIQKNSQHTRSSLSHIDASIPYWTVIGLQSSTEADWLNLRVFLRFFRGNRLSQCCMLQIARESEC